MIKGNYSHFRPGMQDYEFSTGIVGYKGVPAMNIGGSAIVESAKKILTHLCTKPVKEVAIHLHQHVHYHVNNQQIEGK